MKSNLTTENSHILSKFGEKVKFYRKLQNMTQLDLAAEVEIDARHIQRIEKGKINTSIIVAYSIAVVLNVSLNDLFEIEEIQNTSKN